MASTPFSKGHKKDTSLSKSCFGQARNSRATDHYLGGIGGRPKAAWPPLTSIPSYFDISLEAFLPK